jgi:hypothetical protein
VVANRSPRALRTPAVLRSLLVSLVGLSLAWGAVSAWTVSRHASAASEVVSTSEPLSLAAQRMYESLADADVTATTSFLSGPREPLAARQHYEADIARAAAALAELKNGASAGGRQFAANLSAVSTGLPVYAGYVQQAQTYSSLGYPLTGGSFMQVASEQMHLTLLPETRAIYAQENLALAAASAGATGLPWMVITLALAALIGMVLYRVQRWLRRRTHRMVNGGLLAASAAVTAAVLWLVVAFVSARADLQQGIGHGSAPAETLAQASIAAQGGRGDEILNLISRSGSSSFQQDFQTVRDDLGPGPGTLLAVAAASAPAGQGRGLVATAAQDARAWYAVTGQVFRLDLAASYGAETQLVIGTGSRSSAAQFSRLESDLGKAIAADQIVFRSHAVAGRDAFSGLAAGVIVAALLMAAGSAWGISRRLAEYR